MPRIGGAPLLRLRLTWGLSIGTSAELIKEVVFPYPGVFDRHWQCRDGAWRNSWKCRSIGSMQAIRLSTQEYAAYGDVISADAATEPVTANLGFAERYNFLATLENRRTEKAQPNLCVFRCQPMLALNEQRFEVALLERHAFSTQVFIPMNGVDKYLVIVALGGDSPDLATLRAFVATGSQGITYRPGVWHHPLVAMYRPGDFVSLVWEDGSKRDCEVVKLGESVQIFAGVKSG